MDTNSFAERLLELRIAAGLSQAALAQKAGVGQKSISYWEMGEREPSFTNVVKLAEALGVSTEAFREEPGETKRPSKGRPRKAEPEEECCAAA